MAEAGAAIGAASGLLTLTDAAIESGKWLYRVVKNFQRQPEITGGLQEEVNSLIPVLRSYRQIIEENTIDLPTLKFPLQRCGQICEALVAIITKCTAHSDGSRPSFRDSARLTREGEEIARLRDMLSAYKATIIMAVNSAQLYVS